MKHAIAAPSSTAAPSSNSFLRWAGNKRQLLGRIQSGFDHRHHKLYIEPFAGSAALFLHLRPNRAVLGDKNADLIETLRGVREDPAKVVRQLERWSRDEATYYRLRSSSPAGRTTSWRAARFIYLNRLCFNGLYRTNAKGTFNVPFAGAATGAMPGLETLIAASQQLKSATLEVGDFDSVVRSHIRPASFVYLDPPYAVENRRVFRQYNGATFGLDDLDRLEQLLHWIVEKSADFVLSYADCAEARSLASAFFCKRVFVRRFISSKPQGRGMRAELLISNNPFF